MMRTVMQRTTTALVCMLILVLSAPAGQVSAARVAQASAWGGAVQNSLLSSQDHLVTDIALAPLTPNVLPLNQNININFKYRTTQAGGVRIFARPMTGSQLTPNYAASGSLLYPTGSGAGTGSFTITSGPATVDGIRFQMLNADQSVLLFEAVIPVHYEFRDSTHMVSEITFDAPNPNVLSLNQNLTVSFKYSTTQAGGVRIFARPMTGSQLTPNYGASGSPLYPTGSGTGSGSFTITSGPVTVDGIRIQMSNADQSTLLFEVILPVSYSFRDPANIVSGITLSPASPNILDFNENVNLTFNYTTAQAGGVRIFARPMTGSQLTPNYAASGSLLFPTGSGSGTGFFTITTGSALVTGIRIQMLNADQSAVLFETILPVYYQYGPYWRVFLPLVENKAS